MLKKIKQKIKNAWQKVRNFFNDSEIIALARTAVVSGVAYIATSFQSIDWSNVVNLIMNPGFTKEQVILLAGIAIVTGLVTEGLRRFRATDL